MAKLNKKAAMEIETVVVIIVAAALIFLAFALIFDMGGIRSKILNLGGGSSNVDDIRLQCKTACAQGKTIDYEQVQRAVTLPDKTKLVASCKVFENTVPNGCVYLNRTAGKFIKNESVIEITSCKSPNIWMSNEFQVITDITPCSPLN
jgi:hypothetical protein